MKNYLKKVLSKEKFEQRMELLILQKVVFEYREQQSLIALFVVVDPSWLRYSETKRR